MPEKVVPYKADDLEWEEPSARRSGGLAVEKVELARMASALKARPNAWAVLAEYETPGRASPVAVSLRRLFPGYQFAGRKVPTGGSRLYVSHP